MNDLVHQWRPFEELLRPGRPALAVDGDQSPALVAGFFMRGRMAGMPDRTKLLADLDEINERIKKNLILATQAKDAMERERLMAKVQELKNTRADIEAKLGA